MNQSRDYIEWSQSEDAQFLDEDDQRDSGKFWIELDMGAPIQTIAVHHHGQ